MRLPQVHTSRFGVVPKDKTGKWCRIVDMSPPEDQSVNDRICKSLCSLSYVTVWDATQAAATKGREALMAKVRGCTYRWLDRGSGAAG